MLGKAYNSLLQHLLMHFWVVTLHCSLPGTGSELWEVVGVESAARMEDQTRSRLSVTILLCGFLCQFLICCDPQAKHHYILCCLQTLGVLWKNLLISSVVVLPPGCMQF